MLPVLPVLPLPVLAPLPVVPLEALPEEFDEQAAMAIARPAPTTATVARVRHRLDLECCWNTTFLHFGDRDCGDHGEGIDVLAGTA